VVGHVSNVHHIARAISIPRRPECNLEQVYVILHGYERPVLYRIHFLSWTADFTQVLITFDNIGLEGLADMAQNSIRWAPFGDQNDSAWVEGVRSERNEND
jgi:hypothetical protein